MTATLAPAPLSSVPEPSLASPAPPLRLERRHWLTALAVLFVFFAPYQTLVQTAREMRDLETRYNQPQPPDGGADPGDHP